MSTGRNWHLLFYDIRDPKRWRQAYKLIRGFGKRVQYSVFRMKTSARSVQQLRWELERVLDEEDDLLIVELCPACAERIQVRNPKKAWPDDDSGFTVIG